MSADGGYFLNEDVRQFDNAFFGINNLEAAYSKSETRVPIVPASSWAIY
jgi:hypothetical protein